ncbi:MAG: sulfite exporter TauE/SafE family protein [Syntrophobacteraceae bacterium]|jgi:uncharacterized membrane protein YfcA
MVYFVICLAALIASGLTLFSGFGLGTILMPVFAVFFTVEVAIALTAIVHFLNNLFKLVLVGKYADKGVVLRFGVPAVIFAFLGAKTLILLSGLKPLSVFELFGKSFEVTPVKVVIALLLVVFSIVEFVPALAKISFDRKYLPLGGVLSGFFGGLSGHQGALRSTFLLKTGLSQERYIATGVVIACLVDFTRLSVYGSHFSGAGGAENLPLLAAATASAFLGAFIGARYMKKLTMRAIQVLVAVMLLGIALGLGFGLI